MSCHPRRALAALLVFALQPVVLMCVPLHGLDARGAISKVGRKPEGSPHALPPNTLRGRKQKDKQPEQWQLPPEKPSFPGWHLALVKSVVGTTPDGGSMLMPASDAPGEDDGVEQSTELLLQLMSLFQKKHGRMPTEEEVRQWGDVFRTTVVESQRAKMSGKSAQKVVHISGLYVDLEKALVLIKRRRRLGISPVFGLKNSGLGLTNSCENTVHVDGHTKHRCKIRASYFDPADPEQRSRRCKRHALPGYLSQKHKRRTGEKQKRKRQYSTAKCAFETCGLIPSYGEVDVLDPQVGNMWFCYKHKQAHHVNQRSPKCQFEGGCFKQAVFGSAVSRRKMRCATHPRPGDSNLSDPRCNEEGCTLRAAFGVIGRRPSSCRRHAQAGQMDLVHKLCEFISPTFEGCTRQASFGEVGAKARYCKRHRAPHHLQIRWKGGKVKRAIALLTRDAGPVLIHWFNPKSQP